MVVIDAPLAVGDLVRLVRDVPGRAKVLRAGAEAVVVVADHEAPWGLVSIALGRASDGRHAWQVHRHHLERVGHVSKVED